MNKFYVSPKDIRVAEVHDCFTITELINCQDLKFCEPGAAAQKLKEGLKYVGPLAGILGISLEETTAALTLFVDRGMEGGMAGQRLEMILTKLIKP